MDVELEITPEAMDLIIEKGYDNAYGARPLKRVVQRFIEDKLSEEILRGELKDKSVVSVGVYDGEFVFDKY